MPLSLAAVCWMGSARREVATSSKASRIVVGALAIDVVIMLGFFALASYGHLRQGFISSSAMISCFALGALYALWVLPLLAVSMCTFNQSHRTAICRSACGS